MKSRTILLVGAVAGGLALALACAALVVVLVIRPYIQERQGVEQTQLARPVVHILSPRHGEQVAVGGALAVQVNATAYGDRLARLELWADGQLVGVQEGGDTETLAAAFGWQPTSAGAHTLVARAYNSRGNSGQAAIGVEAVAESDADRDGAPDDSDSCPEQYGPLDNAGCPFGAAPGGAEGDSSPLEQALQDSESPPVLEDSLAGAAEGGQAGGGQPGGGDQEGGGGESGEVDTPPDPESSGLLDFPYPVARRWGGVGRLLGWGDEQPEPEPSIPVEVEFLNLTASPGLSRLYCFLSLTDDDVRQRAPEADGTSLTLTADGWNIADYLGGERGPTVEVPDGGLLPLRLYCLGDDQSLGEVVREHASADWGVLPITAASTGGLGGAFEVTYRICPLQCEMTQLADYPDFIPPPVNAHFGSPAFGDPYVPGHMTLMWNMPWDEPRWGWTGEPVDIDGFRVYLNGNLIHQIADPTARSAFLHENLLTPHCGQEALLTIVAYCGELDEEGHIESPPASYGWLIGPDCQGEDWIQIWSGPEGGMLPEASANFGLNYQYASDHGDDVHLAIYPLYQGRPLLGFQASSVEVEHGDGAAFIRLYSTSAQAQESDQLMLAFSSPRIGRLGGVFYSRTVDLPLTWPGSAPDLVIQNVEFRWFSEDGRQTYFSPPADQPLMATGYIEFDIANQGWRPASGFHVRLTDALGAVVTEPLEEREVQPGAPLGFGLELPSDELIRLYTMGCTLQVDSQNAVAEADEANNLYPFSVRYLRLTFQTLRTGDWPEDGLSEYTTAPSIYLWAATSSWSSFRWWQWPHVWIDGGYVDDWSGWNIWHPHNAGIVLWPNAEYPISDILSWFTVDVSECPPPGQHCHYYEEGLCHSEQSHNPCRAAQDNTSASTSTVVYIQALTDGPLSLFAWVRDMDYDYDVSGEVFEQRCYASRDIYPFELDSLPATFTVGSRTEDGCEVDVLIEAAGP